jgi:hypothetical protein
MIYNYIKDFSQKQKYPLAFFNYISGGFGSNIDSQIKEIVDISNVHGSAISVTNVIKLVEYNNEKKYSHRTIRDIFSLDRQVRLPDLYR